MTTRIKSVNVKADIRSLSQIEADTFALAYADIRREEKELAERKESLQASVRKLMGDQKELVTASGIFAIVERRAFTWSLDAVKKYFGKSYLAYLKPDDKLIRVRMEAEPKLELLADVAISDALTFKN